MPHNNTNTTLMTFVRAGQRLALIGIMGLGLILLASIPLWAIDADDTISTVAGTGDAGFNGDVITATTAQLNAPSGVAVKPSGQVYVADTTNHRVRLIDTSGVITTVAGTGVPGDSGDGGPASQAQLNFPYDVALDFSGQIYVADQQNHRIRMIDTSGVLTTVAGTGTPGANGDGGMATQAELTIPQAVTIDAAGRILIADTGNHRIRLIDTSGVITTVAGTGAPGSNGDGGAATAAQLNFPGGIAIDEVGQIYIADTHNHRIRMIDTSGVITTVAGTGASGSNGDGGPATNAFLNFPAGLSFDSLGNLLVADQFNSRIRQIDTSGVITTVVGTGAPGFSGDNGPAGSARLRFPGGIAFDNAGNLFIADTTNNRVRRVTTSQPFPVSQVLVADASAVQTQVITTADQMIQITVPPLSLPATASAFQYTNHQQTPTIVITRGLPANPRFGPVFTLNLLDDNNHQLINPQFTSVLTIVVNYGSAVTATALLDETNLRVFSFDPTALSWASHPLVLTDVIQKRLAFLTDHFTEFALVDGQDASTVPLFLPLIVKDL